MFFILGAIVIISLPSLFSPTSEITWQDFERNMLQKKAVEKVVVINKEIAHVYIKEEFINDSTFNKVLESPIGNGVDPGPHYIFNIGSVESFERKTGGGTK